MPDARGINSMETILTFNNRDQSDWSVVWSTSTIPGMDTATGGGGGTMRRRVAGRRRLRTGSLAIGAFLTMHCRVAASALSGGLFIFILSLVPAVGLLANPLRHFEVYLGQWSLSGPGRAFRIVPMLDGIGIAICINALIRAICACTAAAITSIYVLHSVSDDKLPFTYCRDFDLNAYEPEFKDVIRLRPHESRFLMGLAVDEDEEAERATVGTAPLAWRNVKIPSYRISNKSLRTQSKRVPYCKEKYSGSYPPLYSTPAYNFFYVEVVQLRSDYSFGHFNLGLTIMIVIVWCIIWIFMILEKVNYGRLIWNNVYPWLGFVPWVWAGVLIIVGINSFTIRMKSFSKVFRVGAKELLAGISDALEVAIYIHAASIGSEIIHGKGLNYFASGHLDPNLNGENVWHSCILLLLTTLNSSAAAICAVVDHIQPQSKSFSSMHESTLWVFPMFSKCTSVGNYSHFLSTLIFGGMTLSYMVVGYILIKTALHIIFEYRVKLVFVEQIVVGIIILMCMGLSILFASNGGVILLETIDAIMSGLAMPFVCGLELVALLYIYRSHDFISDMAIATEDNTCSSRIGTQWQIIPFITLILFVVKIIVLAQTSIPVPFMYIALAPLLAVMLAVPLRAVHNAYVFLRPAPRRGI